MTEAAVWDRRAVFETDEWREEYETFKKNVPVLTDEELKKLWPRIQPVIRRKGVPWYIKEVDPSNIAYTWGPDFTSPVLRELRELTKKRVFVMWAYYGFFKPTIRECLAQMPKEIAEECVAFEIVASPERASDFHRDRETSLAFDAGFHTCEVVYYGR